MDTEQFERMRLIDELVKFHPYPRSWFEAQPTYKLTAMFNKPLPKTKKPRPRRIKNVDPRLTFTDGGRWEKMID